MNVCFMVSHVLECWHPGGVSRVGAMVWRYHQLWDYDLEPRPLPHLGVMTPAGLVCLDCPESEPPHEKWTRVGEPPLVTVTPSLNVNHDTWHGWLTDGVLTP